MGFELIEGSRATKPAPQYLVKVWRNVIIIAKPTLMGKYVTISVDRKAKWFKIALAEKGDVGVRKCTIQGRNNNSVKINSVIATNLIREYYNLSYRGSVYLDAELVDDKTIIIKGVLK